MPSSIQAMDEPTQNLGSWRTWALRPVARGSIGVGRNSNTTLKSARNTKTSVLCSCAVADDLCMEATASTVIVGPERRGGVQLSRLQQICTMHAGHKWQVVDIFVVIAPRIRHVTSRVLSNFCRHVISALTACMQSSLICASRSFWHFLCDHPSPLPILTWILMSKVPPYGHSLYLDICYSTRVNIRLGGPYKGHVWKEKAQGRWSFGSGGAWTVSGTKGKICKIGLSCEFMLTATTCSLLSKSIIRTSSIFSYELLCIQQFNILPLSLSVPIFQAANQTSILLFSSLNFEMAMSQDVQRDSMHELM